MRPPVLALSGPTASGKTALALALARAFPIEVVNADSLQVFRGLDVGSAKPTAEERAAVPHHLVDVLDPDQELNAYDYARRAWAAIDGIRARGKIPLLVGGAGFYLRAVESPPPAIAEDAAGPQPTFEEARALVDLKDPGLWDTVHRNDRYRVVRAGRLILAGQLPTRLRAAEKRRAPAQPLVLVSADFPRAALYARIDARVEAMLAQGIVEETRAALARWPGCEGRLAKAIGYRETLLSLRGRLGAADMKTEIQTHTRQYAKRQLTWLRGRPNVRWFAPDAIETGIARLLEGALP